MSQLAAEQLLCKSQCLKSFKCHQCCHISFSYLASKDLPRDIISVKVFQCKWRNLKIQTIILYEFSNKCDIRVNFDGYPFQTQQINLPLSIALFELLVNWAIFMSQNLVLWTSGWKYANDLWYVLQWNPKLAIFPPTNRLRSKVEEERLARCNYDAEVNVMMTIFNEGK